MGVQSPDHRPLTFGSLFTGIGGFDLGLERAGMECRWQVERDEFRSRVLAGHWPTVRRYRDVLDVTGHELEWVDVICGGFPCSPVSRAGRRKGNADIRWLWPEFERIIRVVRPTYVLVENVDGFLHSVRERDADGAQRIVAAQPVSEVLGGLAQLGYDAEWDCVPAAAVGAPHLRIRVFILAYPQGHLERSRPEPEESQATRHRRLGDSAGPPRSLADAERATLQSERGPGRVVDAPEEVAGQEGLRSGSPAGDRRQALPDAVVDRLQGILARGPARWSTFGDRAWPAEPAVGRMAHGVPDGVDRLKALGDAVVPQVAEWIGKQVVAYEGGRG